MKIIGALMAGIIIFPFNRRQQALCVASAAGGSIQDEEPCPQMRKLPKLFSLTKY